MSRSSGQRWVMKLSGIPVGFGPAGEVIRSPIISRTLAQTRVTAFDGQTVVFAGLITKNARVAHDAFPLSPVCR